MSAHKQDIPRLVAALHYAAHQHRKQRRKDEDLSPYINHPIALLDILANEAAITDVDVLCAAVLHDVIEDCSGEHGEFIDDRRREIAAKFGDKVLAIVEDVTDDKSLAKADRKQAQIDHARQLSHAAKLIKLADKTANLRDVARTPPPAWPLQRRQDYFDWAQAVVTAIGPAHAGLTKVFAEAAKARP